MTTEPVSPNMEAKAPAYFPWDHEHSHSIGFFQQSVHEVVCEVESERGWVEIETRCVLTHITL